MTDESELDGPKPLPETVAYSRVGSKRLIIRETGNAPEAWIATTFVVAQEDAR
jgi:hypothetical protein